MNEPRSRFVLVRHLRNDHPTPVVLDMIEWAATAELHAVHDREHDTTPGIDHRHPVCTVAGCVGVLFPARTGGWLLCDRHPSHVHHPPFCHPDADTIRCVCGLDQALNLNRRPEQ